MAALCRAAQHTRGPMLKAPPCLRREGVPARWLRSHGAAARTRSAGRVVCARQLRPVVERFRIHHEKGVSEERLEELGMELWSKWECGPGISIIRTWKVDELVYVAKGSVEVIPEGCSDSAFFYAGDLVRFPKWLEATMTFEEDYEQRYKFLAYGD